MKLYEVKLDNHTLRFNEKELDCLWDCFVDFDIQPTYEMIVKVIQSDEALLRQMVMWHPSNTEVRDNLYTNIREGKYKEMLRWTPLVS